jgi:DNA topoisomerase-6 subunit B
LIRFANRVPLQYQQSACAIFRGVVDSSWKQYGLSQPKGSLPMGPMVLLVHIASVWVPFTSESKEAIAHYPEIIKEIKLALRDCGRKLASFLRSRERDRLQAKRRSIFEMYIGELANSLAKLTDGNAGRIQRRLGLMAARHSGGAGEEAGILADDDNGQQQLPDSTEAHEAASKKATKKRTKNKATKATKKPATKKPAAAKKPAKKKATRKKTGSRTRKARK